MLPTGVPGATDLAEIAYISLKQTDIRLVAIVDDARAGERFLGYRVAHSSELNALSFDLILVTSGRNSDAALKGAIPDEIPPDKLVFLQEREVAAW